MSDYRQARVAGAYAAALVDYLRASGVSPSAIYPVDCLSAIAAHEEVLLGDLLDMFDIAARVTGDPDIALKAGVSVGDRHIGALAQVLMSCANLAEAAVQFARYHRLLGEFGRPALEVRGDVLHLIWNWPYAEAPPAHLVRFMQAGRIANVRRLTGLAGQPADACFTFPAPADTSVYASIFGGNLHFGQPVNQIVAPAAVLLTPIVCADPAWRQQAESEARAVLAQLTAETALQREIKTLLVSRLKFGGIRLAEVAAALGLSTRTLHRRLGEEGCNFRQVLDEVRLTRARIYLANPELSLEDIAFLLGYAEKSSFQNAFKLWTGLPPGEYRRRLPVAARG